MPRAEKCCCFARAVCHNDRSIPKDLSQSAAVKNAQTRQATHSFMTLTAKPTALDENRNLRIENSRIAVKYILPFPLAWLCLAVYVDAPLMTIAALISVVGFLAANLLHHFEWHLTARIAWLGATNVAVGLGTFVVPPESYLSFILVAMPIGALVTLCPKQDRFWFFLMMCLPVGLWFLGWATDYALLGDFEVSPETAKRIMAPVSAVTLFGALMFVVAYSVNLADLNARRLREARLLAEQSSEAKSILMRSVSHEMLTPLHAISGFAEFLNADAKAGRDVSKAQLEDYSRQIISASNALRLIIENIFDFANWSTEGASAETTQVPVRACLDPVVGRFSEVMANKDLIFENRIDPDLKAMANGVWLGAIFKQLLDNAIKFSRTGGRISVDAYTRHGAWIEIVFKDTGPGFPEGASKAAFDAFERLGHETGATSGVGVGLPLAQNFATAMGGKIVIDEDVPRGAQVRVILPLASAE